MRAFDRDLIRGGHYGQRSREPRSKAEHMAAPTNTADVKKSLANLEPSTHGPSRTCCDVRYLVAIRGKADITPTWLKVRLWTRIGRLSPSRLAMPACSTVSAALERYPSDICSASPRWMLARRAGSVSDQRKASAQLFDNARQLLPRRPGPMSAGR